jgi:hypothetical protein
MVYKFVMRNSEFEEAGDLGILTYDEDTDSYELDVNKDADLAALPTIPYIR